MIETFLWWKREGERRDKQNGWKEKRLIRAQGGWLQTSASAFSFPAAIIPPWWKATPFSASCSLFRGKLDPFLFLGPFNQRTPTHFN